MIRDLIPYWRRLFSENSLDKFLKEVLKSFEEDEISDEATMLLHRFTQIDDLRKKGIIDNKDYIQRLSELSDTGRTILSQINDNYLPILPIKAVAGRESGPHYTVEYHEIEDWKYLPKKKSKKKVGIRVDGNSMNPVYQNGDIIICSNTVIEEVSKRQAVIVVCKDNSIFLKNIKKVGGELELISLNPDFEPFKIPLREVLEIWKAESKLR